LIADFGLQIAAYGPLGGGSGGNWLENCCLPIDTTGYWLTEVVGKLVVLLFLKAGDCGYG